MIDLHILNPSRWLAHRELVVLGVLCVMALGLWAFAEIADEVVEGERHVLDRKILLAMRSKGDPRDPLGPVWVEELVRDITALGGVVTLTVVTLSVSGYLLLCRKRQTLAFVLAAIVGGFVLSLGMKTAFGRPRPDLALHAAAVHTASFPSAHSMLSAVAYLTLAALLAQVHPDRRIKIYMLSLGLMLTILIGLSRIYLGVHWPTDVLAGWAAGAAWAALCWVTAWTIRNRDWLAMRFGRE